MTDDQYDTLHTDLQALRGMMAEQTRRVDRSEFRADETDKRLAAGGQRMVDHEKALQTLTHAVTGPRWRTLVAVGMPILLMVATWVWTLSRYPDAVKFDGLELRVRAGEVNDAKTGEALDAIRSSMARTEAETITNARKLDALLLRPN